MAGIWTYLPSKKQGYGYVWAYGAYEWAQLKVEAQDLKKKELVWDNKQRNDGALFHVADIY